MFNIKKTKIIGRGRTPYEMILDDNWPTDGSLYTDGKHIYKMLHYVKWDMDGVKGYLYTFEGGSTDYTVGTYLVQYREETYNINRLNLGEQEPSVEKLIHQIS